MKVTGTPVRTEPQRTSLLLDTSLSSTSSMKESQSQPSEGHSGAEVQGLNKDSQGLEDGEIKDETEEEFRTPLVLVSSSSKESRGSFGGRSSGRKHSKKSSSKTGGSKDSEKCGSSSSSSTNSKRNKETKEKEKDRDKHRRSSGGRKGGGEDKKEKFSGRSRSSSSSILQKDKHTSSSKKRRTSGGGGDYSGCDDLGSIYVRGVSPFSGYGGHRSNYGGGLSSVDICNDPDPIVASSNDSMSSRANKRKERGGRDVTPASGPWRHGHQSHESADKREQPTLSQKPNTSGGEKGGFGGDSGSGDGPKDETGRGAEGDFGGLISKSDLICPFFMEGNCRRRKCNFSHNATPPRKLVLCKFFMNDCCAKKDKCDYLHNAFPCKYYHTGIVCREGDKCKYSHGPLTSYMKQLLIKHLKTAPKNILGDFPRLTHKEVFVLINKTQAKRREEKFKDDSFKDRRQDRHERGRSGGGQQRDDEAGGHGADRGARAGRGDDEMNDNSGRGRKQPRRIEPLAVTRNRQMLKELMQKPGHGVAKRYKETRGTGLLPIPLEYRGRPHPTHGCHGKGRGSHRSHPCHGKAGPKRLALSNKLPSLLSSPAGPPLTSQTNVNITNPTLVTQVAVNVPPPNVPVSGTCSTHGQDSNDKSGLVGDGSNISSIDHGQVVTRDRLPKMPEEKERNFYSSDEDDSSSSGTKKVGDGGGAKALENKREVENCAKIDFLLQEICQQFSSEREQSAAVSSSGSAPGCRYGVDFHRQGQTATASPGAFIGQNSASMEQNNPVPISDNMSLSVPNYAVNEIATSTDAIEGGHGTGPGMPQATDAEVMATIRQFFLNTAMASGVDPKSLISLPAATTEGQQMLPTATPAGAGAVGGGVPAPPAQDPILRILPTLPFNTPKPAVSSWEKLIQARQENQEDDGDLSPPL